MTDRTATDVRLDALEDDNADKETRIRTLERMSWWTLGAGVAIGTMLGFLAPYVIERMGG